MNKKLIDHSRLFLTVYGSSNPPLNSFGWLEERLS
jgi:hypothetical protein